MVIEKIFLHPAFLDTQLGRDIIELDQFVFDVMEGDVSYEEADQRVIRQQMLYLVAWLSRALQQYTSTGSNQSSRI